MATFFRRKRDLGGLLSVSLAALLAALALVLVWRGAAPPPAAADYASDMADAASAPASGGDAAARPQTLELKAALPVPPTAATVPLRATDGSPKRRAARLALVIDDLGLNSAATQRAIALQGPLTLAFLPYGRDLPSLTLEARRVGHELLVHMPMEPDDVTRDPGPLALRTALAEDELHARLAWNLSRFRGFVGINNHMGSRFTRERSGMNQMMRLLADRQLLFLDSMTTDETVGMELARQHGVPVAARDIFLDNVREPGEIRRQLDEVERLAEQRGRAIAIGHPYPETLDVLEQWLPQALARGVVLVPVSRVVVRPTD